MLTDAFNAPETPLQKIVIAVDGPAASGKGTLATAIAAKMGYAYLDTGAVYRAIAHLTIKNGGDPAKIEDVRPNLEKIKDHVTPELLADPALRTGETAEAAAKVAAMPEVREVVRDYQLHFAANPPGGEPGVVLDGRDIGTVVCPDADVKLYITAEPEERARRRFLELQKKTPDITFESVLEDINDRDRRDMTRAISPLKPADDAHILDTTKLDKAQSLEAALALVHAKLPPKGSGPAPAANSKLKP